MNQTVLQILIDKWKHQDSLVQSKLSLAWGLQTAAVAVTSAVYGFSKSIDMQIAPLILMALVWIIASIGTSLIIINHKIDLRVRNTFNEKIVEGLRKENILIDSDDYWYPYEYKVDDHSHPINLWHTPYPNRRGKDTRSTKWNERLLKVFLIIDILMIVIILNDVYCILIK